MILEATTYSAFHGYSWSSVPALMSLRKLNLFFRWLSTARGNFPSPHAIDFGLVSDGKTVVVFSIQNVKRWDAEKRSSDYAAFAVFPIEDAARIDFVDLLENDFFHKPSRKTPTTIDYRGPVSEKAPAAAGAALQAKNTYLLKEPRAIGDLLAQLGPLSPRWIGFLKKSENLFKIECNSWTQA